MRTIHKSPPTNATVTAPPSKSYSVRALLLAAMSRGTTIVRNCLDADDTRYALEALRSIGFDVSGTFKTAVTQGKLAFIGVGGEIDGVVKPPRRRTASST